MQKKRCPNGTRKDKLGNCVLFKKKVEKKSTPEIINNISLPPQQFKKFKRLKRNIQKEEEDEEINWEPSWNPIPVLINTPITPQKEKSKRCPNGTRKNKLGNCVAIENKSSKALTPEIIEIIEKNPSHPLKIHTPEITEKLIPSPSQKEKKKRCPNGTRKNKLGNCVSIEKKTSKAPTPKIIEKNPSPHLKISTPEITKQIIPSPPPKIPTPIIPSYRPTINEQLVLLKTGPKKALNVERCMKGESFNLFALNDDLDLEFYINTKCYAFYEKPAKDLLLYNLSVNKHIDVDKLITPKQNDSNCWFNVLFVIFFISDKGRSFFHFLRQLMIVGTQANGNHLSIQLWRVFALLNYVIEISGQGYPEAMTINTNAIILRLYNIINKKIQMTYVGEYGNPIKYYIKIIKYLNNNDLNICYINSSQNWRESLLENVSSFFKKNKKMPHIIIIQFTPEITKNITHDRMISFDIDNVKYQLDSSALLDVGNNHFCSCVTLEKNDYMYDGMSNHRLHRRDWKNLLNSNVEWSFKGSKNYDGTLKKWCFLDGYHSLHYYRV